MSFLNARLPMRLAAGLRIGPRWKTEVTPLDSGREVRDQKWLYPKWEAVGSTAAFTVEGRRAMRNWFVAVRGRACVFRVRDPLDYQAVNEPIAPAIGTRNPVQLLKTYAIPLLDSGVVAVVTRVQAPVPAGFVLHADGAAVDGELDDLAGLFTPAEPWEGDVFTWSGPFDRWMRFESDAGAITAAAHNAQTADIELVEVRR